MLKLDMEIKKPRREPRLSKSNNANPYGGIRSIISDLTSGFQHMLYDRLQLVAMTSDNYNYRTLFPSISTVPIDRPVLKNNLSSVLKSISRKVIGHYSVLNNSSESLRDKRHVELVGMKKAPIRGLSSEKQC